MRAASSCWLILPALAASLTAAVGKAGYQVPVARHSLQITGMKRIRIGRVMLAALPPGQWRFLLPAERF